MEAIRSHGGVSMKNIYLIRHCKAEGQKPDARLTEEGKQQAKQIVSFFENREIDCIISSPFTRAVETIKPFCDAKGLHMNLDDRLTERVLSSESLPDWMEKLKLTYHDVHLKLAGGESSHEAMNRGVAVILELCARAERNILLVTHGALMSLIIRYFDASFGFDEWMGLSNPDVYKLEYAGSGACRVVRMWK